MVCTNKPVTVRAGGKVFIRRPKSALGVGLLWLKAHVNYQGDDCLQWPYGRDGRVGRGRVLYEGKMRWAHRVMCELAHGEPPAPSYEAAHECGRGREACCNPRHLSWKTRKENGADTRRHGSLAGKTLSKGYTRAQVEEIKALKGKRTQAEIAEQFGCSVTTVQYYHTYQERQGRRSRV
jgi:hypothetical protein